MKISFDNPWPGGSGRYHGKWDDLRRAVDALTVDGTALRIEFESSTEVDHARKAAQSYAIRELKCHSRGWRIQSTSREKVLFIRKVGFQPLLDK